MDWKFFFEVVGLFLTLMVLLYLIIGDNALFRIVTYAFIGVASGYVAVLVIFQVLVPRLLNLLTSGDLLSLALRLVPFVLGILLLFKLFPRLTAVGTLPMAVLVGVGAAVAIGGALFGTLFGQIRGTIGLFSPPRWSRRHPFARRRLCADRRGFYISILSVQHPQPHAGQR